MQRPHLLIIIQLNHRPTVCSPLPSGTQQGAVSGNVALAPVLVLLRLSLFHAEVVPVPLAFTGRMRYNTSLPLPLLLRGSCFLLQLSEGLWNLPSDLVPLWAMVEPVFFCAFLRVANLTLTDVGPINIEQSMLRPSTFHENLPGYINDAVQSNFPFFF